MPSSSIFRPAAPVAVPYADSVRTLERRRYVEPVPAALVSILADEGKLPLVAEPTSRRFGFRRPGLAELSGLRWMAAWDGWRFDDDGGLKRAAGVVGYQDRFDFHLSSDVREICYLSGSRRAVYDLVDCVRRSAHDENRRVIGGIDITNAPLSKMLWRMGAVASRMVMEDVS